MAGRRRESNREELKMRIVDTAAQAFKRLGIKAVHMDDIAGALSISKRTLYELFGDKEQLLLKVFSFYRQRVNQDMQELTFRADNVLEVVLTFYERKVNELCQVNPLFFRDLRKYPKVLDFIHEEQRRNDADAVKYFKRSEARHFSGRHQFYDYQSDHGHADGPADLLRHYTALSTG